MKCPYCSGPDSKVIDSRAGEENKIIRRRRECFVCHKRFSTYERIEPLPLMVIKNNGTREPFDHAKLRASLMRACEKRPISIDTIEKIVAEVEYAISNYVMEVPSKLVGEMVLEKLEKIDPVSYVRFASVYKGFQTVDDFVKIIELFRGKITGKPSRFIDDAGAARKSVREISDGSKKRFGPATGDGPATHANGHGAESSTELKAPARDLEEPHIPAATPDQTTGEHQITESRKPLAGSHGQLSRYSGGSNADTSLGERVPETNKGDAIGD
ncbi:MAG: transcriptional repressor NrdR [Elusimicrobia bacterium]|nr:transcriptional repressor NrdR [Elusimicrobiota bacterium]